MWSSLFMLFLCLCATKAENESEIRAIRDELKVEVSEMNAAKTPGKHILMHHPWSTRSHMMQQTALLQGLLDAGYEVTAVFPHPTNIVAPGYTELVAEDTFGKISKVMLDAMINKESTGIFGFLRLVPVISNMMVEEFDGMENFQDMIITNLSTQNKSVDALIVTTQFSFTGSRLFDHYKCPLISMSPPGWASRITKHMGNSENPSYQPDQIIPLIEPMAFHQRLLNTMIYAIMDMEFLGGYLMSLISKFDTDGYVKMHKATSLILMPSHFVTQSPRALTANTVEVGGIHCRKGEQLPNDLQNFLDSHPEGVVYVSFGSSVKPSQMKSEQKQVFLDTFRQLNHPVIWKWDEDSIPNLPDNVILSKWLPQQDLLAHPHLRVFVTHGGLLSVQEALYHKTPLVGIPLGNDQKPNILRAEKRGFAIMLDWISLDSEQFLAAINKAMYDEELKEKMAEMQELFTDARDTPLERAVWWVEYVIRHEGAHFLKPPSVDLTWYQYHLLDVIAFIVLVIAFLLFIFAMSCRFCCRFCCYFKIKTD